MYPTLGSRHSNEVAKSSLSCVCADHFRTEIISSAHTFTLLSLFEDLAQRSILTEMYGMGWWVEVFN